jgi:hypothetical protein
MKDMIGVKQGKGITHHKRKKYMPHNWIQLWLEKDISIAYGTISLEE